MSSTSERSMSQHWGKMMGVRLELQRAASFQFEYPKTISWCVSGQPQSACKCKADGTLGLESAGKVVRLCSCCCTVLPLSFQKRPRVQYIRLGHSRAGISQQGQVVVAAIVQLCVQACLLPCPIKTYYLREWQRGRGIDGERRTRLKRKEQDHRAKGTDKVTFSWCVGPLALHQATTNVSWLLSRLLSVIGSATFVLPACLLCTVAAGDDSIQLHQQPYAAWDSVVSSGRFPVPHTRHRYCTRC